MCQKKSAALAVCFGLIFLWGCAGKHAWEADAPSQAEEISLTEGQEVLGTLLREEFSTEKSGSGEKQDELWEINSCIYNGESVFYVKDYMKEMAQFSERSQIYLFDLAEGDTTLLYETPEDCHWLNEFCANESYLYWVEYINTQEKDTVYWVMQHELASGETKCIAERQASESTEICLSASDKYVAWYDYVEDLIVKPVVYDVGKQEWVSLPEQTVVRYMPYRRLDIVDDGITYFIQDEEGGISICRYELQTGETDTLYLGTRQEYPKLAVFRIRNI